MSVQGGNKVELSEERNRETEGSSQGVWTGVGAACFSRNGTGNGDVGRTAGWG